MTTQERDALLGYIEFNLTTMVERYQELYARKFGVLLDERAVGLLYDEAYEVHYELERTLNDMENVTVK